MASARTCSWLLRGAVLAACLLGSAAAHALSWPDNLYTVEASFSVLVGSDGWDCGPALAVRWTRLRAATPLGASAEAQWLWRHEMARLFVSGHLIPDRELAGNACDQTQQVRRRGTRFAYDESTRLFSLGAVLELGQQGPAIGAAASASVSKAAGSATARAAWTTAQKALDLGVALRWPSIMGDADVLIDCHP